MIASVLKADLAMTPGRIVIRALRPSRAALLVGLLLAGCLPARTEAPAAPAVENTVTLRVSNRGHADVVVYVAGGSVPLRLGRVPATQRADLVIRGHSRVGAPIRLLLRDVGTGQTYTPEPIWGRAGDVVHLTVQSLLTTSELLILK
jgi:hypothetical protein